MKGIVKLIHKKMKSIIKILFVSLLIMIFHTRCQDRLDLAPRFETEQDFFDEEIHFERAIRGIYAKLTDIYWFNANNPRHYMWHLPGDDITTTGGDSFEIFTGLEPSNGALNDIWKALWEIVRRANTALEKIEAEEGVYVTQGLKNYNTGEALFLRAFAYYKIWNYWGSNAPLVTERIQDESKLNPPSSEGTQILDQAIADFTEAANLLPTSWSEFNRGRVTKSSAYAFLGKCLVFRGSYTGSSQDFTDALAAFNTITDKELLDDYDAIFSASNENGDESLFEFQAARPNFDNIWLSNDFDQNVGSMSTVWGFYISQPAWMGSYPFIPSAKLIAAFGTEDGRIGSSIDITTPAVLKYVKNDAAAQGGFVSYNNPRILRYADILLLKAEAILETGGSTSEVIGLINQIRTRARNYGGTTEPADYSTSESSRDVIHGWIRDERFLELFGEEDHRWFDLKRWHAAGKINLGSFDFSSANPDFDFDVNKHLLFPIPLNEIDRNPNVTQNPGY
jgi:hypothetical protein